MPVSDWKSPGTVASVERNGGSSWHDPDNVKISDDSRAYAYTDSPNGTDWLRCTNFNFTEVDAPVGYDIVGIEMEFECYDPRNPASIIDAAVYLRTAAGQVGDNKASAVIWPQYAGNEAYRTYGGAADAWNAEVSDSDVRASTFGFDIAAIGDPSEHYGYIDHVRARIYSEMPPLDGNPGYFPFGMIPVNGGAGYLRFDAEMIQQYCEYLRFNVEARNRAKRYVMIGIDPALDAARYLPIRMSPIQGASRYMPWIITAVPRIPKPPSGAWYQRLSSVKKTVS